MVALKEQVSFFNGLNDIYAFLREPENCCSYNNVKFFIGDYDSELCVIKNGFIYELVLPEEDYINKAIENGYSSKQIYDELKIKELNPKTHDFLGYYDGEVMFLNADEGGEVFDVWEDNVIRFSYKCLNELDYTATERERLFQTFDIIDYTLDENRTLSRQEIDELEEDPLMAINPPTGFTLVGDDHVTWKWHRPSSVLFYDKTKRKTYLLGQDDDQYFGCELAGNPKTVQEAFEDLTPKEVKKRKYKRQGEWFGIELTDKESKDVVSYTETTDDNLELVLPLEEGGNPHHLSAASIGLYKGNMAFLDPVLDHEQHFKTSFNGWTVFYENTAVRSVSVEGVD